MHNDPPPQHLDLELMFYCLAPAAVISFYLTQIAPHLGV